MAEKIYEVSLLLKDDRIETIEVACTNEESCVY